MLQSTKHLRSPSASEKNDDGFMIRPTCRQKDTSGWRQSMNPELVVGWLPALPCNNRGAKRHETLSASSASLKRSSKGLACHILPSPCRCLARSKPWVVQVSYICSTWMMDTYLLAANPQPAWSEPAARKPFPFFHNYEILTAAKRAELLEN